MIVKVIASTEDTWYSDMKGEYFHAFQMPNNPLIFFTSGLIFYPDHIQIVSGFSKEPMIPVIGIMGYC